ncbi:hypothetical protein BGZ54_010083 [Gamsiella multidivaricata]|nr:hypothetical protein BGZ54_010083 [Gamsiella multidivaricata]
MKSSAFVTKTPGRRAKRISGNSISSTITNGGMSSSRRISCTDTASQNSASYIDERDVEVDENSFYIHLQKMQERYQAQQEPGWLRTQHALLQAKHRIPGSGSPQSEHKSVFGGRKSGLLNGPQPFLSRIHSNNSSPNNSDYSSSPSFHLGFQHNRQGASGLGSTHRHQSVQPYNCLQPGNIICVPRERSLGGLVFHKSFVETHILTPSPYYRGQYLTLDHKVVEIDKDYVREISGFAHPRSVQILAEEMVYNGSSKKPLRVLVLERPLEGDGIVPTRPYDGLVMPSLRQFSSDLAFLESLPELSRALCDFNNLCQEFENTYVYIRGFAAYTLEKLRLIYGKAHRDCVGDSVKLQKMLNRGTQAEQDSFAELMENIVLGKLYQKLFIHSLVPCYSQRDVEIDAIIAKYHRHLFSIGAHRGIDGGACLAATDGPMLQETLKKLGLSEKWRNMRVDHALDGAAGLFRAWDQDCQFDASRPFSSSRQQGFGANLLQETEQERKRRQLRESLRIFVQDEKYRAEQRQVNHAIGSRENENEIEDEEEDSAANAVWNTPLEKAHCIKLVMDMIATVAEDHLMNGQGFGFVQRKRSEVSVTTDDFIPLLALVIIQARMMRLGSNIFYIQRFRINTPKSDLNFALVTFEASIEFLKTDPLGLLGAEQPSSASQHSVSRNSFQGSQSRLETEQRSPAEEIQVLPWGTPSHTGWGFSPPKASSEIPSFDLLTSNSEKNTSMATLAESSPMRPPLSGRLSSDYSLQYQQRHARSISMNFDDRYRRMVQGEDAGSLSSNNSSWSKSPMLSPRFTSGANSPLGANPLSYGVFPSSSETGPGLLSRRPTHQLQQISQRHSLSGGQLPICTQAQQNGHLHRISFEQGRETMSRSTILPLQSPNMTPQLVVKPQIMLPPPKTPPMSGQNTSGRARPISMVMVGALASSAYSSSYGGPGTSMPRKSFSSNHSSPATSPRLGPGLGSRPGSRSNSLLSGPFPMLRANSMSTVLTASELSHGSRMSDKSSDQAELMSPMSPMSPWLSNDQVLQSPSIPSSPTQMGGSLALPELLFSLQQQEQKQQQQSKTPQTTKSGCSRSEGTAPGRIRTSSSSTMSSISTPTTPSTFSSASASTLLDSLNANAQLASPPTTQRAFSEVKQQQAQLVAIVSTKTVALTFSTIYCVLQNHSDRSGYPRHDEPTPTVTVATPTAELQPNGCVNEGLETESSVTPRETTGAHQKVDSGKYISHHGEDNSHSMDSTASTGISTISSGGPKAYHKTNHSMGNGGNNGAIMEHFSHGTALDFEQRFRDEFCLDLQQQQPIPDGRRGSATSLRGARPVSGFQPEKVILLWNQTPAGSAVVENNGNNHGAGGATTGGQRVKGSLGTNNSRLTVSNGDLPSSSSASLYSHSHSSRPYTPRLGHDIPAAGSFVMTEDPQQRTREMMGDFLSELAKVEDGDVLVGNGRHGVMIRQ